jgi:hypothetical protein
MAVCAMKLSYQSLVGNSDSQEAVVCSLQAAGGRLWSAQSSAFAAQHGHAQETRAC